MSTLPLQAPHAQIWPVASFGRVLAVVVTLLDVFTEAQQQARAAHKNYPFADW